MDLKFRVAARIARPVHEVFEAVADPATLSRYFTTGGAIGRLQTGATVTWDFHDYPGAFPVEVVEVVPDDKIVLKWEANEGEPPNLSDSDGKVREANYQTTVTMTFTPLDGNTRTLVEIREEGWRENQRALEASYGNCQGWSQMLDALKAWVEHGINLREGLYV
jgi:uncharacterized protein YndB with AHSA1/START domain